MPRKAKQLVEPIDATMDTLTAGGVLRPTDNPCAAPGATQEAYTEYQTQNGRP